MHRRPAAPGRRACAARDLPPGLRRVSWNAGHEMSGAQELERVREHDRMQIPIAVLIAGPTASGKSALALAVAERLGGMVINTDSMQVYRDLKIITARPGAAEEARAPHLLYGHVDAAENYSVGRFLGDAAGALEAALWQGRVPIFVGGSGLYFKALTR